MEPLDVIITVVMICLAAYLYLDKKHSYWANRGVPFVKPDFFYGNAKTMSRSEQMGKAFQRIYEELKGQSPVGGMYMFTTPIAVVTDLELLRCIYISDFQYFHDHGTYYDAKHEPLSAHLFNLEGNKWKELRSKITPTFTSGKMKTMFPTIVAAGKQFHDFLAEKILQESEFEFKDLLSRYTTDVIGMCAFGIECNSMQDPDAQFRVMGKKIFESPRGKIRSFLVNSMPSVAKILRVNLFPKEVTNFYSEVVRETIDYRLKNNVHRNDFMDLLIQMRNPDEGKSSEGLLSFNEIVAQAFIFFLAGFETSSTLLTWTLYELAINKEIQGKARQHVQDILHKYNGEMTYESVSNMRYLDQILNETLRKYPPIPVHFRVTAKDYTVPKTKTVIQAGTRLFVPVYGIHHDADFFPDPERFDPERFGAEQESRRHPFAWIPFGEGPRICIGLRFGMMQARVGLAHLLNSFHVSLSEKSKLLELDVKSFILAPKGGLWLKVGKC